MLNEDAKHYTQNISEEKRVHIKTTTDIDLVTTLFEVRKHSGAVPTHMHSNLQAQHDRLETQTHT